MRDIRSLTAGGRDRAGEVAKMALPVLAARYPTKLYWFLSKGYQPHAFQGAFHAASTPAGTLTRFRHLVAGRRGGKTLSAAWEVIFYCLHPAEFHLDFKGMTSEKPLWVQVLAKDHKVGFPSEMAIRQVLNDAGLVKDKDYKWNKSEKFIEFSNGSLLQFKTAQDPQSLRGAGLDILWIDEAAAVVSGEAWDVIRPSMVDAPGALVTTTTPNGKNWFYEEFFTGFALEGDMQFRVEYTSIDNPHLSREFIEYERQNMHPAMFKQEYLASFDAMSGLTLSGEWLHYFTIGKDDTAVDAIQLPRAKDGTIKLQKFIGVDPSTGESEDQFAIACIGVLEDRSQAFLLDYWVGKIQFPEQVDKIREWFLKYRPEYIGIESNVYQRVLAQQASRLEGMPPVASVFARGKKNQRIISMSPLFKIGKVRIHSKHVEFIDQWISFDGKRTDNRDDLLDAVEIAIAATGALLPNMEVPEDTSWKPQVVSEAAEARRQIADGQAATPYHPTLGSEV